METRDLITCRVTAESQPDLWRFIHETARQNAAAMPEVVELYPLPDVELRNGRLLLGLPYVLALDAAELADLLGHELTCERGRQDWVVDRTRAAVPGPDQMASAMLHAAHVAVGFERFVLRHVGPLAAAGYYPADLWDGWRWTLRQERPYGWDPAAEAAVEAAGRPPTPTPMPAAGRVPETGRPPAGRPVPLRSLGIAAEAGFARLLAEEFAARPVASRALPEEVRLRPVTFDEVPPEVWDAALGREATAIRAAAALILRRPRASGQDVLRLVVVEGRGAEVLRYAGTESPDLDPAGRTLAPLLHQALRERDYRFEHPLRQHVYVGPAFDRVDVADLLAALDQPNAIARLSYLLS